MSTTMPAAIIRRHGGPDALEYGEIDRPVPKRGEVLVKVEACALNHLDIFVRRGLPGVKIALPHISGGDIVGTVRECADEDGEHLVGQRVMLQPLIGRTKVLGENFWGGLGEYVVAPAENALALSAPFDDAVRYAALPIAYGTAHRMLFTRAAVQPGEWVVVLGASGGVGVACVQFAVSAGARVIACSASDAKLDRLRALGAHETLNVQHETIRARVRELTESGADLVVDFQGKETWGDSIRSVRPRGRIVTCGATTGYEAVTDLRYVWSREIDIIGSNAWTSDDLRAIVKQVETGALEPAIHRVFPLSEVKDAVAELEERRAFGKVVVVPDSVARDGS